eukprot:6910058-Pyramimonas_sp.AAC.1
MTFQGGSGGLLGRLGGLLGPDSGLSGHLGASWAHLGGFLGDLGAILGRRAQQKQFVFPLLGPSGEPLGTCLGFLDRFGA